MGVAGAPGVGLPTGSGGSEIPPNCGTLIRSAARVPPEILVVLDRSASMNSDVTGYDCGGDCGGSSKWAQLTAAIEEVVGANSASVSWGLKVFADSNSACGVGNGAAVPVASNNAGPIATAIGGWTSATGGLQSGSQSPARAAENAAVAYLSALADPNPKYILLVTDGLANCSLTGADPNADDSAGAVAAVQAAREMGFPTFVVGIAAPGTAADATLAALASAGGVPRSGVPSYYSGASATELASALDPFAAVVRSCTFALGPAPNENTSTSYIDVYADGVRVPQDPSDANGWNYTDATHTSLEIYGPICDALNAGTVMTVTVAFRCSGLG